jgi:hypothetical protein
MSRNYVYVMAEAPHRDLTMVSFGYVIVNADDEDEAYARARKHFCDHPTPESHSGEYRFLNDYVIALP